MLSDRDSEKFDEICHRLTTDGPEFMELFGPGMRRLNALDPGRRKAVAPTLLVVALLLAMLLIVVRTPGSALLFSSLACWGIRLRARCPIGGRRRDA
jgi:hypothetical protein